MPGAPTLLDLQFTSAHPSFGSYPGKIDTRQDTQRCTFAGLLTTSKIAIAYLSFGLVGLVTYISATIFVYTGEKEYERSVAGSRASTLKKTHASTLVHGGADVGDPEAAVAAKKTGSHAEAKRNSTSSTIGDQVSPVQAARARLVVRLEDQRASRDEEARSRRSLLF